MKRYLLILAACATAQAQSFSESYTEYELLAKRMYIELDALHKLQAQKRELQEQVQAPQLLRERELAQALAGNAEIAAWLQANP